MILTTCLSNVKCDHNNQSSHQLIWSSGLKTCNWNIIGIIFPDFFIGILYQDLILLYARLGTPKAKSFKICWRVTLNCYKVGPCQLEIGL